MNEANDNFNGILKTDNDSSFDNLAIELDVKEVSNVVLKRLIEEVKNEKDNNVNAYNRLHNRHNRSR